MNALHFDCGPALEMSCEAYAHEGRKACANCSACIPVYDMPEPAGEAYIPNPIDTSSVILSEDILQLADMLAENTHEVWAQGRASEGWVYGPVRNDAVKQTPCMRPYSELSDSEKQYDINTALETLKVIQKLGFGIIKEA